MRSGCRLARPASPASAVPTSYGALQGRNAANTSDTTSFCHLPWFGLHRCATSESLNPRGRAGCMALQSLDCVPEPVLANILAHLSDDDLLQVRVSRAGRQGWGSDDFDAVSSSKVHWMGTGCVLGWVGLGLSAGGTRKGECAHPTGLTCWCHFSNAPARDGCLSSGQSAGGGGPFFFPPITTTTRTTSHQHHAHIHMRR